MNKGNSCLVLVSTKKLLKANKIGIW